MKSIHLCLAVVFAFMSHASQANIRDKNSAENKRNAESFCQSERMKGNVEECWAHPNRTCGRGGTDVAKFDKDPGESWFSCVRTRRQEAKDQAKEDAEKFCQQQKGIVGFCEVIQGACSGRDRKELREFKGPGKNYRACGFSDHYLNTAFNKQKAEERCAWIRGSGQECRVDENRGCGADFKQQEKFDKNPGNSYFVCVKSKAATESEENQKQAKEFCSKINSAVGSLLKCEAQKNNCGGSLKNLKEFKGKGANWAACIEAR
jgi:hypothetical protein